MAKKELKNIKKEKRRKRNMLIWSLLVAFLFVGSTIQFAIMNSQGNPENEIVFGDYSFSMTNNGWILKYNRKDIRFNFLPSEIKTFNLSKELFNIIQKTPILLVSTHENSDLTGYVSYGRLEIEKNLGGIKPIKIIQGFVDGGSLAQVNCINSTMSPVVIFNEGNESVLNKIGEQCYEIEIDSNTPYDVIQFFELVEYVRLGVINEENFFSD